MVDPSVLRPMRDAGLLTETEVPDAFHAEIGDGSQACGISSGRVVRLSAEAGAQSVALSSMTCVVGTAFAVTDHGEPTITCRFREGEGGESFLRMLQAKE